MKKTVAAICAAAITMGTLGMSAVPAAAQPLQTVLQLNGAELITVQDRRDRSERRDRRDRRDRFERRGNNYFYNGFRGYRHHRPGWRHYQGWWFPPSAFSFGFSVNPPRYDRYDRYDRRGRLSARHIAWCEANYRSYRRSDNTFQPYNGPRRQCVSPYV